MVICFNNCYYVSTARKIYFNDQTVFKNSRLKEYSKTKQKLNSLTLSRAPLGIFVQLSIITDLSVLIELITRRFWTVCFLIKLNRYFINLCPYLINMVIWSYNSVTKEESKCPALYLSTKYCAESSFKTIFYAVELLSICILTVVIHYCNFAKKTARLCM